MIAQVAGALVLAAITLLVARRPKPTVTVQAPPLNNRVPANSHILLSAVTKRPQWIVTPKS
jgi:hypothetical protein